MNVITPALCRGLLDELQKLAASRQRMAVPQTRSGRRSMRVDTLLRKDKEGTLYKKNWHDHLPGGLADKKKPQDFDAQALAQGQKVESEHTSNTTIAEEIAMDHLTEDPHYYTKLRKMEGEGHEKSAGLGEFLRTPIPGTRDWVLNTSKRPLQGMATVSKGLATRPPPTMSGTFQAAKRTMKPGATRTAGGVTQISEDELQRLGFGDLAKTSSVALVEKLLEFRKCAYKLQGHMQVQGLPICVENRKGSVRKGVDNDGKPWRTKFKIPYGYISGTEGNDGEEIDVYVGPDKKAPNAFVVHQRKLDGGGFDEDKVMLGFPSEEAARAAYLEHYNSVGKKLLGPISTITVDELRRRLAEKRKHKKIATVDPSNTTLYADRVGAQQPKKPGDFPDMEGSDTPTSKLARPAYSALSDPTAIKLWNSIGRSFQGKKKLAWDGVGSTGSPITSTMSRIDSDEKPDRSKRGDVPSRDGTSPGSAITVKHEAGPDFMTTLPTNAATADAGSQTGATTRM
jgi:hypothetical protein